MNLTLNSYTKWYWKTGFIKFIKFLFLRADSHAQYEIRVYAETMLDTVKKWVPITHACFFRLKSRCCTCFGQRKKSNTTNGKRGEINT